MKLFLSVALQSGSVIPLTEGWGMTAGNCKVLVKLYSLERWSGGGVGVDSAPTI